MFDLTALDYIYIIVVLVSTIWATIRGGVYETIATLSWVVAAVAARFASPVLDGWLQSWFKLSESTVGTLVASYFIVFFVILITVGFFNQKLRDRVQNSIWRQRPLSDAEKSRATLFERCTAKLLFMLKRS